MLDERARILSSTAIIANARRGGKWASMTASAPGRRLSGLAAFALGFRYQF
jgi:hypothetical protein